MIILGLDPSLTNYGWALHDTEATGVDRCIKRSRFKTASKQFKYEIDRYVHLRESLKELILTENPDRMGIEHPVLGESYSEGMYALFLFSLDAIKQTKKDVVMYAPPQVKAFARELVTRPDGWKMMKSDMVDAAKEDTGGKGKWDHNEADAYHVARAAGRFWMLHDNKIQESDLSPYELKAFTHIHTYQRGKKAGQTEMKGILHRENDRFFLFSKEDDDNGTNKKT